MKSSSTLSPTLLARLLQEETRESALHELSQFVVGDDIGEEEVARRYYEVWKALFLSVWAADMIPTQRRCCYDVVRLVHRVPGHLLPSWLDGFWFFVETHWDSLDRWRVDKFLVLVTMFLAESLAMLVRSGWDEDKVEAVTSSWTLTLFREGATECRRVFPRGVAWHVADKLAGELKEVTKDDENFGAEQFWTILQPFVRYMSRGTDNLLAAGVGKRMIASLEDGEMLRKMAMELFICAATREGLSLKTMKEQQARISKLVENIDNRLKELELDAVDYDEAMKKVAEIGVKEPEAPVKLPGKPPEKDSVKRWRRRILKMKYRKPKKIPRKHKRKY